MLIVSAIIRTKKDMAKMATAESTFDGNETYRAKYI